MELTTTQIKTLYPDVSIKTSISSHGWKIQAQGKLGKVSCLAPKGPSGILLLALCDMVSIPALRRF